MWTQQAWCERIPNRTIEHQPGASAEASPKGGPIARQGYTRRVPNLTRAQGSCAVSICGGQAVSEVRTVVCRGALRRRRLEAPRGQKWSARDPRQRITEHPRVEPVGRGRPARAPHCDGLYRHWLKDRTLRLEFLVTFLLPTHPPLYTHRHNTRTLSHIRVSTCAAQLNMEETVNAWKYLIYG